MTTEAELGLGTTLQMSDGADPEVFTEIAEVLDVDGPDSDLAEVEVTHQKSGGVREYIAGLLDMGTITFEVNLNPAHATHDRSTGLWALHHNRTIRNFKCIFSDAGNETLTFPALVKNFTPANPMENSRKASVTLKITGAMT